MFPDNFYPYGAMLAMAVMTLFFAALYLYLPGMKKIGWKTALALLLLGNTLDYFSTWFFTARIGVAYEGNEFTRALMELGWAWYTLYKLVILGVASAMLAVLARELPLLLALMLAASVMLILTAIHNVIGVL